MQTQHWGKVFFSFCRALKPALKTFVSALKPELKTFGVSVGWSGKPKIGHMYSDEPMMSLLLFFFLSFWYIAKGIEPALKTLCQN